MIVVNCCIVVYFGMFDLIINGYIDFVSWVVLLFEKVVVGVVQSLLKGLVLLLEQCVQLVWGVLGYYGNVEVIGFDILLVYFVCLVQGGVLLCGLCVVFDFEYEFQMVSMNCYLIFEVEILFLILVEQYSFILFLLVCEIVCLGGDVFGFVLVVVFEVLCKVCEVKVVQQ